MNTWLSPDDRSFLTSTLAQLQDAYAGLEFVLPRGVIHGDASVGNVLRDYYGSFGWHTREEFEDFRGCTASTSCSGPGIRSCGRSGSS